MTDEHEFALFLGAAQGHGVKPHQPVVLGAGRRLGEQERYLGNERLHLTSAKTRLAVRIYPTRQRKLRIARQQPVEIAGSVKGAAIRIRQRSYPPVSHA